MPTAPSLPTWSPLWPAARGSPRRDRALARSFAGVADAAGVGRVVHLSGPGFVEDLDDIDWWPIVVREPEPPVLGSYDWFCGEAWLGFPVSATQPLVIKQVGSPRTKSVVDMAYRWLRWPIHRFAFRTIVRHRRAERRPGRGGGVGDWGVGQ